MHRVAGILIGLIYAALSPPASMRSSRVCVQLQGHEATKVGMLGLVNHALAVTVELFKDGLVWLADHDRVTSPGELSSSANSNNLPTLPD